MRRITSLYLGGPDPAMPDGLVLMANKRVLCADNGFVGIFPEDSVLVETEPSEAMAREIYTDRVGRMRLADAAILNMTPWRGPSCSVSAAFEAGFMAERARAGARPQRRLARRLRRGHRGLRPARGADAVGRGPPPVRRRHPRHLRRPHRLRDVPGSSEAVF